MPVANVAASPFPPLVPLSPKILDVPRSLGDGKNTDLSGLGDSKYALPCVPESSLPSSFAPLPLTASSVTVDMRDVLSDIAAERSSPQWDFSTSSIENIPTRRFHFEEACDYANLLEVARDIQSIGEGHNEMLNAVSGLANHVIALERLCQRLQKRVDELEDADHVLAYGESTLAPSPNADVAPPGKRRCRNLNRNRSGKGHSTPTGAPAATTPGPSGPPPTFTQAASVAPAAAPAKSGPPPVPSATQLNPSGPAACVLGS